MPPPSSAESARKALAASICVFCLLVPLTIAGANISWGMILASLVAYRSLGGVVAFGARSSPLEKPLWAYFITAIVTSALGVDFQHSARFLNQDLHKVWLYLLFSVALATECPPQALGFMALGFAAASILGISQTLRSPWTAAGWQRAHAFVHPVTFGEQMSIALLGALCALMRPAGALERPWRKAAAWAVLLWTGAALILSSTRSALIGCVAAATAVCLLLPDWRRRALLGIPLALTAGYFSVVGKLRWGVSLAEEIARWRHAETLPSQGQLMRLMLWKVAWRMGLDHPWTGVGLNNYRAMFRHYFTGTLDAGVADWGTAHNLLLHHFAERGVVGLAATLCLLGVLWGRAFQRAWRAPDAWNLWAFAATTAFLIMNLTEVALQVEMVWMLVLFIWIWAETRFRKSFPAPGASPAPRPPRRADAS